MQKWLTIFKFFIYIQSSLTNPVLEFKNQKTIDFTLYEASRANFNAGKRILKCQPFLRRVYGQLFSTSSSQHLNGERVTLAIKQRSNPDHEVIANDSQTLNVLVQNTT